MDKNSLCREIFNIKDFLSTQILQELVSTAGLTEEQKKNIHRSLSGPIERSFDLVVDKVLES